MGFLSFEEAVNFFGHLPTSQQSVWSDPQFLMLDSLRQPGLKPAFFLHQRGEDYWYHAVHLASVAETPWRDVQSAYGYGGPLSWHSSMGFLQEAWEAWTDWCTGQDVLAEFIRFQPLMRNWRWYGGAVQPNRQTVWIDLSQGDPSEAYNSLTKRQLKKALREGVKIAPMERQSFGSLFASFYNDFIKERGADPEYRFPPAYLEAISGWKAARGLVASHRGEVVAMVLLLVSSDVLEYYLGASTPRGREMGAMRALMHECALLGRRLGCRCFHLGGGTDGDPNNPLLFFKAGFSPLRGEYYIGHHIHRLPQYEELKQRWRMRHGEPSQRILFYR